MQKRKNHVLLIKKTFLKKGVPERVASPPPRNIASPPPRNVSTGWGSPSPSSPSPSTTQSQPSEPPKKEGGGGGGGRGDRNNAAKKEEEFIQSGGAKNQIESFIVRKNKSDELSRSIDPVSCNCSIRCPEFEVKMKNNKPDYVVFKIDVTFHNVSWTIFRRWKQWTQLESIFLREIRG